MQIDVADLRRRLGAHNGPISQAALGALLGGLSQATISRIEAGIVKPRGLVLERLAQLAGVSTSRSARKSGNHPRTSPAHRPMQNVDKGARP